MPRGRLGGATQCPEGLVEGLQQALAIGLGDVVVEADLARPVDLGFDLEADGRRLRFRFPAPVGPDTVRKAVVALLGDARARLGAT